MRILLDLAQATIVALTGGLLGAMAGWAYVHHFGLYGHVLPAGIGQSVIVPAVIALAILLPGCAGALGGLSIYLTATMGGRR